MRSESLPKPLLPLLQVKRAVTKLVKKAETLPKQLPK